MFSRKLRPIIIAGAAAIAVAGGSLEHRARTTIKIFFAESTMRSSACMAHTRSM